MSVVNNSDDKIRELQMLEGSIQSLSLQKQAFGFEVSETQHALDEVKSSNDDIFRIVGSVMIKSDSSTITKELERKLEVLNIRLKSIEKQEEELSVKAEKIRSELSNSLN